MSLSSQQRLELILTYYILWKMKREPRVLKRFVRHYITNRVKAFQPSDLNAASIADLGTKDHDLLDGLLDDDHTQYALLAGRATGQTLIGGTASGDDLTLESTSHATKGQVILQSSIITNATNTLNVGGTAARFLTGWFNTTYTGYINATAVTSTIATGNAAARYWIFRSHTGAALVTCATLGEGWMDLNRAGDISHLDGKFPILDKASGNGVKVDTTAPTFGWRDLLGVIETRGVGATDPADATYNGNIKAYQFSVNDECWVDYHIPHDYVIASDIHLHFHWSHIGTLVTGGNATWGADITYAKGHDQAAFPASVNTTVVGTASTTQYQHIITEVKISDPAPGASEIDTDDLEPDGVIMIRAYLSANNITVSGGAVPDPFLHFVDVHYQSTNIATKSKVPDFYT